ncbi:TPA: hypothetical protein HA265_00020 [Candidatus Woesearchaeota archaeon]|nr:hypothetical protein [Candidatus Woesearchaeota archaeon]
MAWKIGVIGLGVSGSVGFELSSAIHEYADVRKLYINDRDGKTDKVAEYCRRNIWGRDADYAPVSKIAEDTDITIICLEGRTGVSKGGVPNRITRQHLYNGNIESIVELASVFGRSQYKGRIIVVTNPTDLLTYSFIEEMSRHMDVGQCQVMGFNHIDTFRAEKTICDKMKKDEGQKIEKVVAEIWGEHGPNSMMIPSQIRAYVADAERRVIDYPELAVRIAGEKEEIDEIPARVMRYFSNTTKETVQAIGEVLRKMQQGSGRFVMSVPYQHKERMICVGQPIEARGDWLQVAQRDIAYLHPKKVLVDGYEKTERERWEDICDIMAKRIEGTKKGGAWGYEPLLIQEEEREENRKKIVVAGENYRRREWKRRIVAAALSIMIGAGIGYAISPKEDNDSIERTEQVVRPSISGCSASYDPRSTSISHRSP